MTDYATKERQKFLREVKYMQRLQYVYAALAGLSVAWLLATIANLFTKGHP